MNIAAKFLPIALFLASTLWHPRGLQCKAFTLVTSCKRETELSFDSSFDRTFPVRSLLLASLGGRFESCYKRLGKEVTSADCTDTNTRTKFTSMSAIEIAEDLEEELIKSMNQEKAVTTEKYFIACMDGWMVAYNRSDRDAIYYGERTEKLLRMMESFATTQGKGDIEESTSLSNYNFRTTVDPYASVIHFWLSSSNVNVAALREDDDFLPLRALRVLSWMEVNQQVVEQSPFQQRLIQYNKVLKALMKSEQTTYIAIDLLESMYNKTFFRLQIECDGKTVNTEGTTSLLSEEIRFQVSIMPDAKSFATVLEPLLQKEETMSTEVLSNNDELLVRVMKRANELNLLNDYILRKVKKGLNNDGDKLKILLSLCQS